jgi:hypothetical protein
MARSSPDKAGRCRPADDSCSPRVSQESFLFRAVLYVQRPYNRTALGDLIIPLIGAALATSCVHYAPRPIAPTQPLTTIEARTTDDGRLRSSLVVHGAATPEPPRWGFAR